MSLERINDSRERIMEEARRVFPEWEEAKDLYFKINSQALSCIVESNIGGGDFFPRFIKNHLEINPVCDVSYLFDELKDEFEAYQKIKNHEREVGESEIQRLLKTRCDKLGWCDSLDVIGWSIEKNKKHGSDEPYVRPNGDQRYRVNKSIKLWVMSRSWEEGREKGAVIGIVDQIERVVRRVDGRHGLYVTYQNDLYEIQDKFKLARLLTQARRGEVEFFSNEHRSPDPVSDIVPKEFICLDW